MTIFNEFYEYLEMTQFQYRGWDLLTAQRNVIICLFFVLTEMQDIGEQWPIMYVCSS